MRFPGSVSHSSCSRERGKGQPPTQQREQSLAVSVFRPPFDGALSRSFASPGGTIRKPAFGANVARRPELRTPAAARRGRRGPASRQAWRALRCRGASATREAELNASLGPEGPPAFAGTSLARLPSQAECPPAFREKATVSGQHRPDLPRWRSGDGECPASRSIEVREEELRSARKASDREPRSFNVPEVFILLQIAAPLPSLAVRGRSATGRAVLS